MEVNVEDDSLVDVATGIRLKNANFGQVRSSAVSENGKQDSADRIPMTLA